MTNVRALQGHSQATGMCRAASDGDAAVAVLRFAEQSPQTQPSSAPT